MEKAKGRGHPAQQKTLVKPVLETIATELATDGTLPTAAQLVETGDVAKAAVDSFRVGWCRRALSSVRREADDSSGL